MRSVDVRTRGDADVRHIDVVEFCEGELLDRLERNGALAADGARRIRVKPLTIKVDDHAYTFRVDGDRMVVRPGEDDDTVVARLDAEAFSDLVQEVRSPTGLFTGGAVAMERGNLMHFVWWEPVLWAMFDGRAVFEPGSIDFRDPDGAPLDLTRSFTPDDPDEEISHFLTEAGFLHLRGWFDPAEMRAVSADMDAAFPAYTPDDGRSWWARTGDGEQRCVRMQYFHEHSRTTAALLDDERFLRLRGFTADEWEPKRPGENLIEALEKPLGVVEGLSDLPWHKDCSLGRHSSMCCTVTAGISVTGADEHSGQLVVLAGSHRANVPPMLVRDDVELPQVPLATETGDVSVHLSCTLHMAMAPTLRPRRVMYTGLCLPPLPTDTGAGDAKIRAIREGARYHVSQPPSPVQPTPS